MPQTPKGSAMKTLRWIGIVIATLIVLFLVGGLFLPRKYHVERSVVIDAPPAAVFPAVNTLKEWPSWTAWTVQRYPDMQISFDGPESGVGAKYSWTGKDVGVGQIVITESRPYQDIQYDLDFDNGKYLSTGGIKLVDENGKTKATWWNEGDLGLSPVNRYFGLMMDGMMGPDFQTGLDNLKRKVEAAKAEKGAKS
jgi:uncharacterized protein YndB with AHSA1/START domain